MLFFLFVFDIYGNMAKGINLTAAEKQKITNSLSDGIFTLDISKELCKDHQTTKKVVEKITKLITWSIESL